MVIAALASFALLLIAWIAAPSGATRAVEAAKKAPSAEMEAQPAMAKAA